MSRCGRPSSKRSESGAACHQPSVVWGGAMARTHLSSMCLFRVSLCVRACGRGRGAKRACSRRTTRPRTTPEATAAAPRRDISARKRPPKKTYVQNRRKIENKRKMKLKIEYYENERARGAGGLRGGASVRTARSRQPSADTAHQGHHTRHTSVKVTSTPPYKAV